VDAAGTLPLRWATGLTAVEVAADAAGTTAATSAPGRQSAATMPILRVILMIS
jgi:hypothetical protein